LLNQLGQAFRGGTVLKTNVDVERPKLFQDTLAAGSIPATGNA
jgi:hypothetical protein